MLTINPKSSKRNLKDHRKGDESHSVY